jgi:hypothetical protein
MHSRRSRHTRRRRTALHGRARRTAHARCAATHVARAHVGAWAAQRRARGSDAGPGSGSAQRGRNSRTRASAAHESIGCRPDPAGIANHAVIHYHRRMGVRSANSADHRHRRGRLGSVIERRRIVDRRHGVPGVPHSWLPCPAEVGNEHPGAVAVRCPAHG